MSEIAISAEGISKSYQIARALMRQPYRTLQEEVVALPRTLWKRALGRSEALETFWALSDVSFEVREGEVVGIIGRNGAGKSTLLKILSRITEPTLGRAEIYGRIGALLEVGTGFHPELTGRENIFLSGAILGMRRNEIARRFEEIVNFAEVEQFIDTPAKRYSSGMYTRLAFAVAAHLEPEILLVDEVLAVGDSAFQKKCLGKMEDVAGEGRTVFFVSHNTQAVRQLCSRCVLLDHGRVLADGPTDSTLAVYNQRLRDMRVDSETGVNNPENRRGSGAIRFTAVSVEGLDGAERYTFEMGDTIRFRLSCKVNAPIRGLAIVVALRSGMSREIVTSARHVITTALIPQGETATVVIDLPNVYIRPGEYPLYLHASEAVQSPVNYDVLDDLTPPLVIAGGSRVLHDNFDPAQPYGVFSLPSRMAVGKWPEAASHQKARVTNHERPQIVERERRIIDGDLTTRLVIGTAQLGLPYGRHRTSPVMSEAAAFRILDAAWSLGVRAFDTAEAYGSSAARLRAWSDARGNAESLEVVTKCSVDFPGQSLQALEESARMALSRFEGIGRLVLLTHGPVGADRWPALLAASMRHHAVVGQSVYSPDEVRAASELPGAERLQVPGNVLDHRAILARGNSSVFLDVRSIYLQGVLLDDPQRADLRAPGSAGIATAIQSAAAALEMAVAPLLVASMLRVISPGDRLVIGVDDVTELGVLPAAFEIPDDTVRRFQEEIGYHTEDPAFSFILDPRRWPTQPAG